MASIDLDQVRHVARLAALSLSDAEAEALCAELAAILDHISALEALDVADVEPTFHPVPISAPLRPDRVQPSLPRDEVLAAAPESEQGGFAVPKVLEGD